MKDSIFLLFCFLMAANAFAAQDRCNPGCEYVCNGGVGDPMVCECHCHIPVGTYHCDGADMYGGVKWSEDVFTFPRYALIDYSVDDGRARKTMRSDINQQKVEIYSPDGAVRAMLDLSESTPKLNLSIRLTGEPLRNPGPFDFFDCK